MSNFGYFKKWAKSQNKVSMAEEIGCIEKKNKVETNKINGPHLSCNLHKIGTSLYSNSAYNPFLCKKVCFWVDGWMDGWMVKPV